VVSTFIIIFWATMMGLLLKRELPSRVGVRSGYRTIPRELLNDRYTRMGIYLNQSKVGYAETTIKRETDGGYRIVNTVSIQHGLLRTGKITLTIFLTPERSLDSFRLSLPTLNAALHGRVEGKKMRLTTVVGRMQSRRTIPFDEEMIISNFLSPLLTTPRLRVGKAWTMGLWNPITLEMQPVTVDVRGRQKISWNDKIVDAYIVFVTHRQFRLKAWVAPDGTVIQQQVPFGLMMKLEESRHDRNREPDEKVR